VSRWELYCRGVAYVFLQATFVVALAHYNIPVAFVLGSAISYLWTGNVIAQHGLSRVNRAIYAIGAGSGGVLGMVVGSWIG
jgi:hypothetical protein